MSLNDAHAFAFSLATTLMAAIVIFQAGDGTVSVAPASEYDGDASEIIHEIDPFAPLSVVRSFGTAGLRI